MIDYISNSQIITQIQYENVFIFHSDSSELKMTVSRDKYTASPTVGTGETGANAMEKHWGQARQVAVHREPNTSLGISIVGGKVCILVFIYKVFIFLFTCL